jgi:hypothetical protein
MQKVFQRFRGAHLKLKLEKCQLFQKKVLYLGHASPEVVTSDPKKMKAIQRWPLPRDKHDLRSFFDCVPATGCSTPDLRTSQSR